MKRKFFEDLARVIVNERMRNVKKQVPRKGLPVWFVFELQAPGLAEGEMASMHRGNCRQNQFTSSLCIRKEKLIAFRNENQPIIVGSIRAGLLGLL
jgi:hypothetical protein